MKKIFLILLISVFFYCCKHKDSNFKYIPLDLFKYEAAIIAEGTSIQIISYSGGPVCTPETMYYFQYIGINKDNNDTVRILTPCEKFPVEPYPTEGSFTYVNITSPEIDEALKKYETTDVTNGDKLVVFNKVNVDIETGNYKTAIGALSFK